MKKLLVLLMTVACALCLVFALAGCTGENGESSSGSNTQQGDTGDTGNSDSGSDNTGDTGDSSDNTDDSGNTGSDSGEHIHNYGNIIPEKPATCTEEGLQAHYYCSGCQTYFNGEKNETTLDELKIDVDSTAHNYGELFPEIEADCANAGRQAYYHCVDCGKYFDDKKSEKSFNDLIIPAGHILEENQVVCKTCGVQLAESLNFELKSGTYEIVSGTPTSDGKIMIPKIYNNLPVISIGDSAFRSCKNLESITIPDSVTSIGYFAFDGCKKLESVYITDIAAWCNIDFEYNYTTAYAIPLFCEHNLYLNNQLVTELTADMLQGVTTIKSGAFLNCTSLESVTITDSVTTIGSWAFGCTNLKGVYITDIAAWCYIDFGSGTANPLWYAHNLYLNNQLVTELTAEMLQGVTEIKDYAFAGFGGASVTIPEGVTSIGDRAFYGCTSLTEITIPNSVTSIGRYAFRDCTNLTSVKFENPNGWYYTSSFLETSGTDIKSEDLQKPENAARYLKETYDDYYWKRKTT